MTDHDPTDQILYTRGISSVVFDAEGNELGHATLLDCDDTDPLAVHQAAQSIAGFTAVYESSGGSFHLWNLRVRDFDESVLDSLTLKIADAEHIKQSKRRERYVLRLSPKTTEDGETYKDSPTLREVYDDGEGTVSAPHYQLVTHHAESEDVAIPNVEDDRLEGAAERCETHSYMTLTDEGKRTLREV